LNTIYVVVPQQGVVVRVGGETGCGGPSFAFCAYHDSFAAGVDRVRYAVVPYPCTQGGGTCFVDAGEDVVNALAASASHEISETTTDPDAPPVAAGGWFEDRTGEENADVCQATSCLADLTLGGTTYPLNSLWSNLGSDCVAAVPCSAPRACEDPAPGACVVPTHGAAACALEWIVHPNLGSRRGLPSPTVVCADGQPFCDFDGAKDGRCTFRLAACLNNQDPRVACIPTAISTADLSPRTVNSSDPADQANVAALLGALAGADAASTAAVSGGTIAYQPPASTPNACTPYVDIVVPVRVTGSRVGPGSRTFRIAAKTTSGTATNRLRLVCNPTFP
jgi:hypothetical protein